MTLIEVLAAIVVLTIGLLGLVGGFNSARKLTLTSERRTVMAHVAQRELERLQTLKYSELGMKEAPSHSSETSNPDYYVKEGTEPEYQYGTESAEAEKLVIGGAVLKEPTKECTESIGACKWKDESLGGYIYDFVTWHNDPNCTSITCAKTEKNYKRLTVVATIKVPSGTKEVTPVRVSTMVTEPAET